MVVKKGRGFNITVDNTENAFLVEDMKKWVLHRKVDFNQYYNPNDTISTYKIYRSNNTIKLFMELFKTDLLKREYRRFQNEVLINVLECGLCRSFSCGENHKKFFLGCDRCKKARCQPCIIFNIAR